MKVKKGMASSVSFDMMPPKKRSGRAPSSGQNRLMSGESGASSTPITKKRRPFAASEKATG